MSVSALFGWTGTALILAMSLPQVWRTCVHGHRAGVPASRAWLAIAVATVWLGYGLYGGGVIQLVLNSGVIGLNVLLLTRLAQGLSAGLALVGGAALLTVLLGETGGLSAVGAAAAVAASVVYLPQLLALRRHGPAGGVSALSLWLQGASGCCWITYGLLRSEVAIWSPNVVILAVTAWTLVLLRESPTAVVEPSTAALA